MPTAPTTFGRPAEQARQAYDRFRGSAASRGYGAAWRTVRLRFLQANPLCKDCEAEGAVTAATEVHHIEKVRDRPDRLLDEDNLMALCTEHHSTRTARGE